MKILKTALLVLLLTSCANTEDVDDSDVHEAIANSQGEAVDEDAETTDEDGESSPKLSSSKSPHEVTGERAALLYDIASAALKKSDATISYAVKCTYAIKPLSVKGCMVKTGYLPADAKTKIGRLLVEAKNLPRKKTGTNQAVISTNYTCVKGRVAEETSCSLDRD